jgi:hypothetical protein
VIARSAADTPVEVPGRKSLKREKVQKFIQVTNLYEKIEKRKLQEVRNCTAGQSPFQSPNHTEGLQNYADLGQHCRNVEIGRVRIRVCCSRLRKIIMPAQAGQAGRS